MTKNRIYILGTAGSGKSFLAKKLSKELNIKPYDLDDVFWIRKYDKKRDEKSRKKLFEKICNKKKWILEGVYSSWTEYGIIKANIIIWLDTSFYLSAIRIIKRKIKTKSKNENWIDILKLLNYVRKYKCKDQPAGYYRHKEIINKHSADFVYIKNKKQLNKFLKDFLEN